MSRIYTDDIPKPRGTVKDWFDKAKTDDIIHVIKEVDKIPPSKGFCKFASQFSPTLGGLSVLWSFVKYEIQYVADTDTPLMYQDVKTPAALWDIKKGDCKSKTIFVNKVLQCLNIPYIIRFTSYGKNADYTHVYTVAILDGKKIIIDTVYDFFNKEARYFKKLDIMTKVRSIHGLSDSIKDVDYRQIACERQSQLIQRQKYVTPKENINFNELSEGSAALKILERRFLMLKEMSGGNNPTADKALSLVRNALKGVTDFGVLDDSLISLAARIKHYSKQNKSAVSHGIKYQQYKFNLAKSKLLPRPNFSPEKMKRLAEYKKIGSTYPNDEWVYLDRFSFVNPADGSIYPLNNYIPNVGMPALGTTIYNQTSLERPKMQNQGDDIFYNYGVGTDAAASYNDFETALENYITAAKNNDDIIGLNNNFGWVGVRSQAEEQAFIEGLQLASPVMSNYINNIYRADNTMTNGTISPAVYYPFLDDLSASISGFTINDMPTTVQTKKVFQDQFIASCVMFSGISEQNIKLLAENCAIFDNGETPETTLLKLINIYNPNIGVCIPCPIIAAIAAALVGVIGAIGGAIAQAEKAKNDSADIDSFLSTTSNFQTPTSSTLPQNNDWMPQGLQQENGGGSGSGSGDNGGKKSSLLIPALLLGGGLYLASRDD